MSLFIETLRLVDGEIQHLPYHQARWARTLAHFWPDATVGHLSAVLQEAPRSSGVFKVRVVYDGEGVKTVEYAPYAVRQIRSLQLVEGGDIDYTYKSADRHRLTALAEQKGEADEIIIVKNGLLTDTSYSNIALYDGSHWVTPRLPLLKGTMRQWLIDQGQLVEADIPAEDVGRYEKVALINAMMPLGTEGVTLSTQAVLPIR